VTPFDLIEPRTLPEALELLADGRTDTRAASGCTALMLMMKASVLKPARLVSLRRIAPTMSAIERCDGELRIGALASLAAIERCPLVQHDLPALARALRTLANVRVRNQATLGGHLAHADPHMDLPPLLTALDALVVISAARGERVIPVAELVGGYLETTLASGELVTAVRIPVDALRRATYVKVTSRSADDWPSLGVAVALRVVQDRIDEPRIVIGAAVDRPTRLQSAESILRAAPVSESVVAQAAAQAADAAQPIADQHGSAGYKRQLIRVHTARALREALGLPLYGSAQ
jgi:carbon-monoxide dehydrogenase medium subunit